jgi:hypothetical protein
MTFIMKHSSFLTFCSQGNDTVNEGQIFDKASKRFALFNDVLCPLSLRILKRIFMIYMLTSNDIKITTIMSVTLTSP